LSLDLSFNLAWSAVLPRLVYYGLDQNTVGPLYDKKSNDPVLLKKLDPMTACSNTEDVKHDRVNPFTRIETTLDRASETRDALNSAAIDDPERPRLLQENKDAIKAANGAYTDIRKLRIEKQNAHMALGNPWDVARAGKKEYAEDLDSEDKSFKVSFKQSFDEAAQEVGDGMEGQLHSGKNIYGAVLAQLYGNLTSQYLNISLEIRGDPYWIGPGTFDALVMTNDGLPDPGFAVSGSGDNTILLTYRYPLTADENAEPIFQSNETYSGFYIVTKVVNNFQNGEFRQTLSALKMPLLNFSKVLGVTVTDIGSEQTKALENDARDGQPTAGEIIKKPIDKIKISFKFSYPIKSSISFISISYYLFLI
jgi:hypothetical protein